MRKISIGIISTLSYLGISQGTIKSLDRYNTEDEREVEKQRLREMRRNRTEEESERERKRHRKVWRSIMPDEGKNFGGHLILDFRK